MTNCCYKKNSSSMESINSFVCVIITHLKKKRYIQDK